MRVEDFPNETAPVSIYDPTKPLLHQVLSIAMGPALGPNIAAQRVRVEKELSINMQQVDEIEAEEFRH